MIESTQDRKTRNGIERATLSGTSSSVSDTKPSKADAAEATTVSCCARCEKPYPQIEVSALLPIHHWTCPFRIFRYLRLQISVSPFELVKNRTTQF